MTDDRQSTDVLKHRMSPATEASVRKALIKVMFEHQRFRPVYPVLIVALAEQGLRIVPARRKPQAKQKTIGRAEAALPGGDHSNLTTPQKRALARAARGFYLYRRIRYPPRNDTLLDLADPGIAHPLTIDSLLRRRLIEPDNTANSFRATKEGQAVYARRRADWFLGVMRFTTI